MELLDPSNPRVLAFVRRYEDECVLVVANLSRFAQVVELDLRAFAGTVPVELFGRGAFPQVTDGYYPLTLSPYSFFWFALAPQPAQTPVVMAQDRQLAELLVAGPWDDLVNGQARDALRDLLPDYLQRCAWFGGKARHLVGLRLVEVTPVPVERGTVYLTAWRVEYAVGEPETYALPLALATGRRADELEAEAPEAALARIRFRHGGRTTSGLLYDAMWAPGFAQALLATIAGRRRLPGRRGALVGQPGAGLRGAERRAPRGQPARLLGGAQNNTSVAFGEQLILKLLRRIDEGINPELEIGTLLAAQGFPHVPALLGALEYQGAQGEPATLAVLHRYAAHQASGWEVALAACARGGRRSSLPALPEPSPCAGPLLALAAEPPAQAAKALLGDYLATATLLGRRTAELHRALAVDGDPRFAPEGFTPFSQRALYQTLRNQVGRTLYTLRRQLRTLPAEATADAEQLLAAEPAILARLQAVLRHPLQGRRIRIHGDYHLEQILDTGADLLIIDFEGEPARLAAYRRLRHTPLKDVVAMVRSFFDAASTVSERQAARGAAGGEEQAALAWAQHASAAFLRAYLEHAAPDRLIPERHEDRELLLDLLLLERVLYEVGFELDNRPERVGIALRGARMMLASG